jgi:hypothetical protein
MSKTVKASSLVKSPNAKTVKLPGGKVVSESEVLMKGKIRNAKVNYIK